MKTVVRTEKLTKRFGDLAAVDGIDLDVHEGEVFGFLGPNGAGKTTTLRLLCALIAPTSGTAEIAGFRLGRDDPKIRAAVGILTELPGLYERQSAWDNLIFYATLYGLVPSVARSQAERYLRLMGLWERRGEPVATFSRGTPRERLDRRRFGRSASDEPAPGEGARRRRRADRLRHRAQAASRGRLPPDRGADRMTAVVAMSPARPTLVRAICVREWREA